MRVEKIVRERESRIGVRVKKERVEREGDSREGVRV